ncbi:MAG: hypothetical protein ACHQNT_04595 [Bacteroidia bacterium]
MAKSGKRPLAVFLTRNYRKIGDFIIKAKAIVLDITNSPGFFVTPDPPLATVTADIGKLEDAETTAQTRVVGSAAARDLEYDNVLEHIHGLLGYVQKLADKAADEAAAIAIIQASGYSLKVNGIFVKPPLSVKQAFATGEVILRAKAAGRRASYDWQMSTDGTTWSDLPSTLKAKTIVDGLTVDVRTYFRFRAILPSGTGSWSASVSIVVQ